MVLCRGGGSCGVVVTSGAVWFCELCCVGCGVGGGVGGGVEVAVEGHSVDDEADVGG